MRSLSLLDRRPWLLLYQEILGRPGSPQVLYDTVPDYAATINALLLMCGVSPAWVDWRGVEQLLFGTGDRPPILVDLNFPALPVDPEAKVLPDGYDPEAWLIAALWGAGGSLTEAIALARDEPAPLLELVLRARSRQIQEADPKFQEKEALKEAEARVAERAASGAYDELLRKHGHTTAD